MAAKTKTKPVTQAFDKLSFRFTPKEDTLLDDKFCAKAQKLRDAGNSWDDIAEELGANRAICSLAAHVADYGRIPFRNEDELAKKVVKIRDNEGSQEERPWARIGARLGGMSEGRVQTIYTEASGTDFTESYIGRGGRPRQDGRGFVPAAGEEKPAPKKAAAKDKAKPAKKAAPKKAAPKGKKAAPKAKKGTKPAAKRGRKPNFGDEPTLDSVSGKIAGKTVTTAKGEFEVESVAAVKKSAKTERWGAKVKTTDGKERVIALDEVTKVA